MEKVKAEVIRNNGLKATLKILHGARVQISMYWDGWETPQRRFLELFPVGAIIENVYEMLEKRADVGDVQLLEMGLAALRRGGFAA